LGQRARIGQLKHYLVTEFSCKQQGPSGPGKRDDLQASLERAEDKAMLLTALAIVKQVR